MPCSVCHRDIRIVARGLCGACYQRWQKRGTTDYAPERVRGVCSIKDCGRPHRAHGYCQLHYERVRATGSPLETKRPDSWGAKSKHPLYNRWANMMRHRAQHPVAEEWQDFLQFVADIGEPPSSKAKLFAARDNEPIGPQNYVWKESYIQRVEGEDEATFNRRRMRAYRRVRNEDFKGYDLKRHYGLTREQLENLKEAQGHRCAICGLHEEAVIEGRKISLAVDHCHETGKVRGLLCHKCNRALGGFKDDPKRLRNAIIYLEHASAGCSVPK